MAQRTVTLFACLLIAILVITACAPGVSVSDPDPSAAEHQISATEVEILRQRAQIEGSLPIIAGFATPPLDGQHEPGQRALHQRDRM